jgi:hypothetical protein
VPAALVAYAARDSNIHADGELGWAVNHLAITAGIAGVLLFGHWPARDLASRRARRYATARVHEALAKCWARERELTSAWGSRHGLTPSTASFTEFSDATPLMADCEAADYANVLRGDVDGNPATFFHLTQVGPYGLRAAGDEDDAWPSLRWFTCLHLKAHRRDLAFTLHPRKVKSRCPLNDLDFPMLGEAWRQSPSNDPRRLGRSVGGREGAMNRTVVQRLIDAGQLPPSVLELERQSQTADRAARREIGKRVGEEIKLWREQHGAGSLRSGFETMRSLMGDGFRDIELEAIEFNKRYRLRVRDTDDIEIVSLFPPAFIVAAIERVDDLLLEFDGDNMLLAVPGRQMDAAQLDQVLIDGGRFVRHMNEGPVPG